jgi:hypothetical protein
MNPRVLLLLGAALVASACGTQQVRLDTAKLLATKAAQVQRELETFSVARQNADIARQRNANRLLRSALQTEAQNAATVAIWRATDETSKLDMQTELMRAIAETERRAQDADAAIAKGAAISNATKSRVASRSDQLSATAKTLSGLAEKEKLADQLAFYISFLDEVRESVAESAKAASQAANNAGAAANKAVAAQGGKP